MSTGLTKNARGLRNLFRRDPFLSMRDDFEQLFSRLSAEVDGGGLVGEIVPSLDLSETDKTVELRADLPGLKAEDIDIQVSQNTITVSGERKEEKEEKGKSWHRVERKYGAFSRTVALPCEVDQEKIDANYKDGVLTVTIPKGPGAQTRKVKVKS